MIAVFDYAFKSNIKTSIPIFAVEYKVYQLNFQNTCISYDPTNYFEDLINLHLRIYVFLFY